VGAAVLYGRERGPVAQVEGAVRLIEVRGGNLTQLESIAGGKDKMIEVAEFGEEVGEEVPDRAFVEEIDDPTFRCSAQGSNRLLDAIRIAGCDDYLRTLRGCLLRDGEPDAG
jgi:hypothetical protein